MPLALGGILRAQNIGKYKSLFALCWLQGGRDWEINVLGAPFEVLWRHSLGGSIGGGSAVLGLDWDDGTCGVLP